MTDPAAIAAGLTARSKRAIVLIGEDWTCEGWGETLPNPNDSYSLGWGKDRNKGLAESRLKAGTGVPGRPAQWEWRLTPLGLAVRQHLHDAKVMREEQPAAADNSEAGDDR